MLFISNNQKMKQKEILENILKLIKKKKNVYNNFRYSLKIEMNCLHTSNNINSLKLSKLKKLSKIW